MKEKKSEIGDRRWGGDLTDRTDRTDQADQAAGVEMPEALGREILRLKKARAQLESQVEGLESEMRYLKRLSGTLSPEVAMRRIQSFREHAATVAIVSLVRHWRELAIEDLVALDLSSEKRHWHAGYVEGLARLEAGIEEAARAVVDGGEE